MRGCCIDCYKERLEEGGRKSDSGKAPMHLIPPEAFWGLASVLQFGARKYEDRNWEKGMDYSRVYSSTLRHLTAWWGGENNDPESGLNHLLHALCGCVFLAVYQARGIGKDDRPCTK